MKIKLESTKGGIHILTFKSFVLGNKGVVCSRKHLIYEKNELLFNIKGKQLVLHSTGGSGGKAILTTFAYDENGLRTQKIYNSVTTTNYYYNGSVLMGMVTGTSTTAVHQLFSYDASGNVVSVDYSSNGGSTFNTYYYIRNVQNDVVKLINSSGTTVVEYAYDTWGKLLSTTGSLASTLGANQPFRYRGYVYDTETGWYYLQSRYYDPSIGRFISADVFLSTGQGVLGHNSFAYCLNNPVNLADASGCVPYVNNYMMTDGPSTLYFENYDAAAEYALSNMAKLSEITGQSYMAHIYIEDIELSSEKTEKRVTVGAFVAFSMEYEYHLAYGYMSLENERLSFNAHGKDYEANTAIIYFNSDRKNLSWFEKYCFHGYGLYYSFLNGVIKTNNRYSAYYGNS